MADLCICGHDWETCEDKKSGCGHSVGQWNSVADTKLTTFHHLKDSSVNRNVVSPGVEEREGGPGLKLDHSWLFGEPVGNVL